jgi:hypothetical protein
MGWFAVRNVYLFGVKDDGVNIFEERIVCFMAKDFSEAHEKGKEESQAYASSNSFVAHDEQLVYRQDGEPLIDGYEVWSELYESNLSLDSFYNKRYSKYIYKSD